jgi:hypothetical protein
VPALHTESPAFYHNRPIVFLTYNVVAVNYSILEGYSNISQSIGYSEIATVEF